MFNGDVKGNKDLAFTLVHFPQHSFLSAVQVKVFPSGTACLAALLLSLIVRA